MRTVLTILLLSALALPVFAGPVTSYSRMVAELQSDAAQNPAVRLAPIGTSAGGRRRLWLVRAADPAADPTRAIRLLVLCRQHGDEPASTEAALRLLHGIASGGDTGLVAGLSQVVLYIIPMVNPDGAEADTRANAAGADLNRDWGVFDQPETRAVAHAVALIHPQVIIDAHNWDGGDHYDADCVEVARIGETPLVKETRGLQAEEVGQLRQVGYSVEATSYGPDADLHLAHRYWASRGLVSCLVETHSGSPRDTPDFQRRQGLYIALIHGLIRRYAAGYSQEQPRLARLEGSSAKSARDAVLFPPAREAARPISHRARPSRLAWLWPVCALGLSLWAANLRPAPSSSRDSATARRPGSAPASARRSAARPGRPRYQC